MRETHYLRVLFACCAILCSSGCFPAIVPPTLHIVVDPDGGEPKDDACRRGIASYDAGDYPDALKWWTQSANANSPCGINNLGKYYYEGLAVPQNLPRAIALFKQSAAMNYPGAQYNLGVRYLEGDGVQKNHALAMALLQKAASRGYSDAENELGMAYMYGTESTDFATAERYFLSSYNHGNMKAAVNLGHLYYHHDMPDHFAKALRWYTISSMYDQSQYQLGVMYWKGEGVKPDLVVARDWLKRAAMSGDVDGEYLYGLMNYEGDGGPRDEGSALRWFKKAADRGNAAAMTELATAALTTNPPVTVPRMQFAFVYYRAAAMLGDEEAQANLASIYVDGLFFHDDPNDPSKTHYVIAADPEQAYVWYSVAATKSGLGKQFYAQAMARIAALRLTLSAEQLAQAKEQIEHQLRAEAAASCNC